MRYGKVGEGVLRSPQEVLDIDAHGACQSHRVQYPGGSLGDLTWFGQFQSSYGISWCGGGRVHLDEECRCGPKKSTPSAQVRCHIVSPSTRSAQTHLLPVLQSTRSARKRDPPARRSTASARGRNGGVISPRGSWESHEGLAVIGTR